MRPLGLQLDDRDLASCVQCGLCLPHCPTFRVTGDEAQSPRGRIALMRAIQWDGGVADGAFRDAIDTCVQCRGCETACPSGVPFGRLMTGTRAAAPAEVFHADAVMPTDSGPIRRPRRHLTDLVNGR